MLSFIFTFSCQKEKIQNNENVILSKTQLDSYLHEKLTKDHKFKWSEAPSSIVASALINSDSVALIGYSIENFTNISEKIHEINLKSSEWQDARQKVIDAVVQQSNKLTDSPYTERELFITDISNLPVFAIKIHDVEVIDLLRKHKNVRYVEPGSYTMGASTEKSGSGCGGSSSNVNPADYSSTSPSASISWHLNHANVPQAWSSANGDNVTLCIIDTGLSPSQNKMNGEFTSGYSSGRFVDKMGTYTPGWWWWADPDGPNDQCGHGTSMASFATAPRAYNGTPAGVAYKSNLLAIRATSDVVVNYWREKEGVADALYIAGNRSDVKVISMSIGDIFWSSTVADGIYYANNKGKLIFAAAGTSTSWTNWYGVIFPAYMSETVAVTGIKDGNGTMQECDICHKGSEVDFVAVMERSSDSDRVAVCLPFSGNGKDYVGGSSAATATTAGIAALVWSKNLGQSKTQVLNKMKTSASNYPYRDSDFGWGIVNAQTASN